MNYGIINHNIIPNKSMSKSIDETEKEMYNEKQCLKLLEHKIYINFIMKKMKSIDFIIVVTVVKRK